VCISSDWLGVAAEIISAAWTFLELAPKCGMFPIAPQDIFRAGGK
jgi:hypothetical protein